MYDLLNRVLSRIFGPKKDEIAGEWRKLHNEELNDLYSLPTIVAKIEISRAGNSFDMMCDNTG
jgi:hypothetical protein